MRKLLGNLFVTKGKREQDELGPKEITPADRVRALDAKREQDKSGPKEISPTDRVPVAHEPQDLDPPSVENDSQGTSIGLKRYAGLTGWAWVTAGGAVLFVWIQVGTLRSGGGSLAAAAGAIIFAVAAAVYVFRDWLKPRRLSRVWRVLSVTGVALVCSVVALWLATPMLDWGSCVSGDCQSGHGTFNYVSGDTYEGEWRNGIPGPRGTYKFANGEMYVGEWRADGVPVGQGTTTWPNGDVYVGEHGGGFPYGTGTKTYADGRVESGRWVFGRLVEPE